MDNHQSVGNLELHGLYGLSGKLWKNRNIYKFIRVDDKTGVMTITDTNRHFKFVF